VISLLRQSYLRAQGDPSINNGFFWIRYPDPVPLDFDHSDSEKLVLLQFYKVVLHIEISKRLLCQCGGDEVVLGI